MRIDDDIRHHAGGSARHVLRVDNHSTRSLLSVARAELVANLRDAVLANTDLRKGVALAVPVLEDAVNPARLIIAHRARHITETLGAGRNHHTRRHTERYHLANQNIIRVNERILGYKASLIELSVLRILHLARQGRVGPLETLLLTRGLILALLVLVCAVEDAAEQTTL